MTNNVFKIPSIEEIESSEGEKVASSFSSWKTRHQVSSSPIPQVTGESYQSHILKHNTGSKPSSLAQSEEKVKHKSTSLKSEENESVEILTKSSVPQQSTDKSKNRTDYQNVKSTKPVTRNCIVVNPRQRGNPILKSVRNVPWEFGEITPDYEVGAASCVLFLSVKYHKLKPDYIHERMKQLGGSYNLRVLLVLVDVADPHHSLKELAKISLLADFTLILAFSNDEAGRYLETYKAYENKPPDQIMEQVEGNYVSQVTESLTAVKSVNKTNAMTLLSTFGTVADVLRASEGELELCPGFGPQKANRLYTAFHEPFLREHKTDRGGAS